MDQRLNDILPSGGSVVEYWGTMSVQSVQAQITSVQRDIQRLQNRLSEKTRQEATKSSRVAQLSASITSSSSASTVQSKTREIRRIENDLARLQQDKATLTKQIAGKTQKLHRYEQDFYKETTKEHKKMYGLLERKVSRDRVQQRSSVNAMIQTVDGPIRPGTSDPGLKSYDAFVSHASEDKEDLVRPLAAALRTRGFNVWYDEFEIQVGDSLRRSIDRGVASSRFGIVVLSPSFFAKNWPQYELDGLVARESMGGKVILPLWHKVSKDEVLSYSPTLADKVALNTASYTIEEIAEHLGAVLGQA